ncbi:RHS repeat-associated core domain-containing protein [Micromonospora sp. NPDC005806]|uniref:RHS repeat-associated core domain-containing protein n=1 Tax=Micromonospora sp. NPDC005806 TaxID=3364234 RepID=UPI003674B150
MPDAELVCEQGNEAAERVEQLRLAAQEHFRRGGDSPATREAVRQFVNAVIQTYPQDVAGLLAASQRRQLQTYLVEGLDLGASLPSVDAVVGAQLDAFAAQVGIAGTDPATGQVQRAADPIEMFSGQFVHEADDLVVKGAGMDFRFHRVYRSQVAYLGPLGPCWDHAYNLWIRETGDDLLRSTGTLREDRYTRHPRYGQAGFSYWVPPDGQHATLGPAADSYLLTTPGGVRFAYRRDPARPDLHRVVRIADRFDNALEFEYADDRLRRVRVNHPDRLVAFDYDDEGRLTVVRDFTGRAWSYRYDDLGDLVAVTTPATTHFPAGTTTRYEYSTAAVTGPLAHNLLRVIDGVGGVQVENVYGTNPGELDFNRVVRQRAGGEWLLTYERVTNVFEYDYTEQDRPASRTTLVAPDGHWTRRVYNSRGNLLLKEENGTGVLRWQYRYNRDGALVAAVSPEGRLTQYHYGRDDFLRVEDSHDDDIATHPGLTARRRRAFGNVLATVRRGRVFRPGVLALTGGPWGDIFPDPMRAHSDDIVVKWTRDPDYQQPLTASDPRYTASADPRAPESADYHRTLVRYEYTGPPGDPYRLPTLVRRPATTQADGSSTPETVERFTDHDVRGRLLRHVDAAGTVTAHVYFGPEDGVREGYLQSQVADPDTLAVRTEYEVNDVGMVTAIRRPRYAGDPESACTTRFEIDALDRVVRTESPAPFRYLTRTEYDARGLVVRVERELRDEAGRPLHGGVEVLTRGYDEAAHLVEESFGGSNPAGHLVTRYDYDAAGRLARTTSPRGTRTIRVHDGRGLEIAVTRGACTPEASTRRTRYDGDGRPVEVRSHEGRVTRYGYDALGRITRIEDDAGNLRLLTHDKGDNLLVERLFGRRPDGGFELLRRTEYRYDERGRRIEERRNLFPAPLPVADPAGAHLAPPGPGTVLANHTFYDALDRAVRLDDAAGAASTVTFDALGRERVRTDPLGNEIRQDHDPHGNVLRIDVVELVRDPSTAAVTGSEVFSTWCAYDELNRRVRTVDGFGNATETGYDSRDRVERTVDPLGNVRRNEYDVYGRLVAESIERTASGLGGGPALDPIVCRREYDPDGHVVTFVDGAGARTDQDFDALNRRVATRYADGSSTAEAYDGDDLLRRTRDANGTVRHRAYDGLGRLIRVTVAAGTPAVEGERFESYGYDAAGAVVVEANDHCRITTSRDSLGRAVQECWSFTAPALGGAGPYVLDRGFDARGALTELGYPAGRRIAVDRDALGRITRLRSLTRPGGLLGSPTLPVPYEVARFEYRGTRPARARYGNGTSTGYAYDGVNRLVEIRHRDATGDALRMQYLYDAAGDVRLRTDLAAGQGAGDRLRYDSIGQLTHAEPAAGIPAFDPAAFAPPASPPPEPVQGRQAAMDALAGPLAQTPPTARWTYDPAGSRTQELPPAGPPVPYISNALHQYTEVGGHVLRYDRAGNLVSDGTREYRYDSRHLLTGVVDSATGARLVTFLHDAEGRRVAELRGGTATTMVLDGLRVLEERRSGALVAQHVYGGAEERPVQSCRPLQDLWVHEDSVGTPRLLTDVSGVVVGRASYDLWGNRTAASGTAMPAGYAGRRYDTEAAAYDLRARAYSPALGRFLQRDPKGSVAGTSLYTYGLNNPARYVDLLGLEPGEAGKAVRHFAGGAAGALHNVYGLIEMGVISWLDIAGVPMNEEAQLKRAAAGEWFQSLYGAVDSGRFLDWVGEGLTERSERMQALEAQGRHFDAAMVFGDTAMNAYAIGRGTYGLARGGISFGLEVRQFGFLEASKGLGFSLAYWATRYKEPNTWGGLGGVGEVRTAVGRGSPYENWASYVAQREIGQAVFRAEQAIGNGEAATHPAVQRFLRSVGTAWERARYGTAVNRLVDDELANSADPILSNQVIQQGAFGRNARGNNIFPDYRIAAGNQTVIDITTPGEVGKALKYPAGNILEPLTGTGRTLFGPPQPVPLGGRSDQSWSTGIQVSF